MICICIPLYVLDILEDKIFLNLLIRIKENEGSENRVGVEPFLV